MVRSTSSRRFIKYKRAPAFLPPLLSLFFFPPHPFHSPDIIHSNQGIIQDALTALPSTAFPVLPAASVKIPSSQKSTILPSSPPPSVLPSQVDLNFNEAFSSSRASSCNTTAIPDLTVFTTDSQQSTWPPSKSPSLPATSAQPPPFEPPQQQDFVLFESPPARTSANRTISSPATAPAAAAFGSRNSTTANNRRHSSSAHGSDYHASLQNQRVAQIIQATGHQTSPLAFTNRFSTPTAQNQQFYASLSAPSSALAVNQNQQRHRPARPPVPLFSQGIDNQPSAKMDLQDALAGLGELSGYEGGASTAYSSPAVPAYDFGMSSSSSSTTNIGTVSPHDLLISAPNSTAFTNLTSPSFSNESPEFTDSFDVSPNFGSSDFDTSNDSWFPLFPPQDNAMVPDQFPSVDDSPALHTEDLEVVETMKSPAARRKSASSSPTAGNGHGRHSSVSGVNSRRRDKPLPPIIVDNPGDTVAMKRARNTLAARKSRERKAQRLEDLEEKILKLEQERDHWKRIAMSRVGGS